MRTYPGRVVRSIEHVHTEEFRPLPQFLRGTRRLAKAAAAGGAALLGVAAFGAVAALATAAAARRKRANRLRGKTVVITGSSRGLGLALAEEFGRQGARVVLTARDAIELRRAHELLLEIDAVAGPQDMLAIPADLRNQQEADGLLRRVTSAWGPIDVLVNNAGVITVGPVENLTTQDFRDVMDSNFFTGLNCTMSVLPEMLKRGSGTIVNITSIGGKLAVPHLLPYTASKFAAVGFSEGLHAEMRNRGVHVLTVCPGLMRTGSHLNAVFSGNAEREYRWFSLAATMPGLASSARNAARRIVRAVLARETEIFITPQAELAGRLASIAPEVTAIGMSLANFILPNPIENPDQHRLGADVRDREPAMASVLGWNAARRYNEVGHNSDAR
jgi:NAD(P)-dependent dehydrogenase (short-subunit alcohol dehydrogenase family)